MDEPLLDDVSERGMLGDTVECSGGAGGAEPRALRDVDGGGLAGIVLALGGGDTLLQSPLHSGFTY